MKMKNYLYTLIFFILIFIIFSFSVLNFSDQVLEGDDRFKENTLYRVNRVVDGDTIEVQIDGEYEIVRLLGVDSPEVNSSYTKEECYGPEASAYLKELLKNQSVYLSGDKQNNNRDKYNRLLRYVFMQDGTFVEEALLKNGYAYNYDYFPSRFKEQFNKWEEEAQQRGLGLWRECENFN